MAASRATNNHRQPQTQRTTAHGEIKHNWNDIGADRVVVEWPCVPANINARTPALHTHLVEARLRGGIKLTAPEHGVSPRFNVGRVRVDDTKRVRRGWLALIGVAHGNGLRGVLHRNWQQHEQLEQGQVGEAQYV